MIRCRTDLTGKVFGQATVIGQADDYVTGTGEKRAAWNCLCGCGKSFVAQGRYLSNGDTKSCGCLKLNLESRVRPRLNLIGLQFGRLTVIRQGKDLTTPSGRYSQWECVCACGSQTLTRAANLLNGRSTSCGCIAIDKNFERSRYAKTDISKENLDRMYRIWGNMKDRCGNPKNKNYYLYGARGITVCDEWKNDFMQFVQDMGDFTFESATIGRIDGNKGYSPFNCRWESYLQQGRNTSRNVVIEIEGQSKCLSEWLQIFQISKTNLYSRMREGRSHKEALIEAVASKYGFLPSSL